jgi:hypothetical protein
MFKTVTLRAVIMEEDCMLPPEGRRGLKEVEE